MRAEQLFAAAHMLVQFALGQQRTVILNEYIKPAKKNFA